jgi:hypothetical protein
MPMSYRPKGFSGRGTCPKKLDRFEVENLASCALG